MQTKKKESVILKKKKRKKKSGEKERLLTESGRKRKGAVKHMRAGDFSRIYNYSSDKATAM